VVTPDGGLAQRRCRSGGTPLPPGMILEIVEGGEASPNGGGNRVRSRISKVGTQKTGTEPRWMGIQWISDCQQSAEITVPDHRKARIFGSTRTQ
jgi:hypothetical protein